MIQDICVSHDDVRTNHAHNHTTVMSRANKMSAFRILRWVTTVRTNRLHTVCAAAKVTDDWSKILNGFSRPWSVHDILSKNGVCGNV